MKNKFISFLLASVMTVSMVLPVQAADTFRDVPKGHWAYNAIEEMADQGIISGMGNGKFAPDGYVTTAQFVSMLMRMFFGEEMAMDDTEYSIWYGKVLQWAAENGLLYKMEIGSINRRASGAEKWNKAVANAPIYREEVAVLLYNYLKQNVALPTEDTLRNVTAAKIPDLGNHDATVFEQFAIAAVYELGCLSGTDKQGTFSGDQLMTRAQACAVLSRVQKLVGKAGSTTVGADWVKLVESGKIKQELKGETLVNGAEVTEKNVASRINELRRVYPQGMSCTNENFHYIDPRTGKDTGNSGCYALAMYIFDHVFGYGSFYEAKAVNLTEGSFGSIKPGDHIRIKDLPHSIVVLEAAEDYVKVVEGNFNKKVYWDNIYTKEELLGYQKVTVYSAY
ncbi:S-layer homology domain-containing protein [Anaerotignum sp.]